VIQLTLQSEAGECGLACLAMISAAHGRFQDLQALRRLCGVSLKGATLRQLMEHAERIGFSSRPLRLELSELAELRVPCILHWDLNHFVVLKKLARRGRVAVVLDPAVGERRMSLEEVSRHFTGVALELWPHADFKPQATRTRLGVSALTSKVPGLKRVLLQIFVVALALELFAITTPLLNQLVVDEVLASGDLELLLLIVLAFGLLLAVQMGLNLARRWMVIVLTQRLSLQWMSQVFAHLIRLPARFFEKRHLGDITSRFDTLQTLQHALTTTAVEAVLDSLIAVAALVLMLIYSPPLAGVSIAAVMLYGCMRWAFHGALRHVSAERLVMAARERTHFLETLRAMTPLKLFGQEGERQSRWQNLMVDVQNRDTRSAKLNMGFSTVNGVLFGAENLVVMWLGARAILAGQADGAGMTVGMLFAFLAYRGQFTSRMSSLIDHVAELKMLPLHLDRLADIALEPPERDELPMHPLDHLPASLELRHVSFRYGEGEPWILKDASFRVADGECVALTGPSGGGKTTLLKIALGLLEPSEGEVLFGGQRIGHLGARNYRRVVGTVMQEDVLLTGSIAENISFFDLQPDLERVQASARWVQVHDDIVGMPMGYQTLVGDLGAGLSGGQRQRILLARAIYKQPRLLAMDEATSHLDVELERKITTALARLPLTRLVIAHRPETIAGAQRVLRVGKGGVQEVGVGAAAPPATG
jgi:ATP-binding cassette, subfamily B, bacterial CvaB/MchF/RaxB